jgi:hypothetical protein
MIKKIIIVGHALYGERWQSELARDLDVDPRTVRRWVAGDTTPGFDVTPHLIRLCEGRIDQLRAVIKNLKN